MIHSQSPQQGAGQMVSSEVNRQSDAAQGLAPGTIDNYVAQQNQTGGGGGGGDAGGGGGSGGMGGADIAGAFSGGGQSSLNLPDLYNSLNNSAGIKNMEDSLTAKSQAYNDAMSKINDNPFLSESNRVGRGQKLTNDYNNDVKTTQDALTMAKQDVQTQLDLQTKQYDINSQAHTQALNEFNSLLSSGALAGATGNDIAAITKGTGISSSMIQAAIKSQTAKDTPTSVTTVDDGTNQYAVVMNTRTGAIISKQVLGASAPRTSSGKGGSGGSNTDSNGLTLKDYQNYLLQDVKNKYTLKSIYNNYKDQLPANYIYNTYTNNSPWGKPTETLDQVLKGQFKY